MAVPLDLPSSTLCVSQTYPTTRHRSLPMLNFFQNRFQVVGDRFLPLTRVLNPNGIQNHRVGESQPGKLSG
jgi:hypothetical protein